MSEGGGMRSGGMHNLGDLKAAPAWAGVQGGLRALHVLVLHSLP